MKIELTLPVQIKPAKNSVKCVGGKGTESTINCTYLPDKKKIIVNDAFKIGFKQPEKIQFTIQNLVNPPEKITTNTWNTTTITFNNY